MLFVQDESDLGSMDLVTHAIDTGDYPPIRQLPRHILSVLCGEVEETVEKML